MKTLLIETIAAELHGTRIGLIGFSGEQLAAFAAVLQTAGCLSHSVPGDSERPPGTLDRYDALVVYAGDHDSPYRVKELVAAAQPALLVGPRESILRNSLLQLRADEVVFMPFPADEFLFRIYRAIRRRAVAALRQPGRRQPTILVADDDPNIRVLLQSVLPSYGLDCHVASNGREALAMVRDLLPDLLLLDIQMPLMSGLDVLRHIRWDPGTRNVKVLLLTASRDFADIESGSCLGADGYLAKPFNHLLLARRIKDCLPGTAQPAPVIRPQASCGRLETGAAV